MSANKLDSLISDTLLQCQQQMRRSGRFHMAFWTGALIALLLFLFFFSSLAESFLIAIAIACFFFVCVIYFVLRLYFYEQKPRQFIAIRDQYLAACRRLLDSDGLSLAQAAEHAAQRLDWKSFSSALSIRVPQPFQKNLIQTLIQEQLDRLSHALYWKDVHYVKELFLLASTNACLQRVKQAPTTIEAHTALASAYTTLASHYSLSPNCTEKFKQSAQRAIEELNILKEYEPNSAWVYKQLALNFQALKMPLQELQAYETYTQLCPTDLEALVTLGTLYFQQGINSKGLKIYERLRVQNPSLANTLIHHYGAWHPIDI